MFITVLLTTFDSFAQQRAYENCFEECPLHYTFNHNAVFHVLFLLGLLILMVSEKVAPSSSFFKEETFRSDNNNVSYISTPCDT